MDQEKEGTSMDFLGTTSRGVQRSSAGFLADIGYENTSFASMINNNATRAGTPSSCPRKRSLWAYLWWKRIPHSNDPFQNFPSPKKTHCLQVWGLPPPSLITITSTEGTQLLKAPNCPGSATDTQCSSWSPTTLPCVALFSVTEDIFPPSSCDCGC